MAGLCHSDFDGRDRDIFVTKDHIVRGPSNHSHQFGENGPSHFFMFYRERGGRGCTDNNLSKSKCKDVRRMFRNTMFESDFSPGENKCVRNDKPVCTTNMLHATILYY